MKTRTSFGETVRRNFFDTYRRTETKLHELKSILWECTLRCNRSWKHCMGNGLHLYPSIDSEPTRCSLKLAEPEIFS